MSGIPPAAPGPNERSARPEPASTDTTAAPERLSTRPGPAQRPFSGVLVTSLVAGCVALLLLATLVWFKAPSRVHMPAEPTGPPKSRAGEVICQLARNGRSTELPG